MANEKVAIITGASRGIGAEIAKQIANNNIAVVVNYASDGDAADAVVNDIQSSGGKAIAFKADVSDYIQVSSMFDHVTTVFGGIDILVNNAGVMQPGQVALSETDEQLFDKIVSVNLKGAFNTMKLAAQMLRQGGRVINFSSSVVGLAFPGYSVYAATKAGIETMSSIYTKELRGKNITVNTIAPGPTATELFLEGKSEEQINGLAKMPPLERLGTPEDIAKVVSFIVSDQSEWINGQTIRVNGGII